MRAETPGWRWGSSREAVRHFPQGFTRDDSPGEDERWPPNANPNRLGYRLGSAGVIPSALNDEGDVICDKSMLHCEDERIGILIF
jgi:hypothetical protein